MSNVTTRIRGEKFIRPGKYKVMVAACTPTPPAGVVIELATLPTDRARGELQCMALHGRVGYVPKGGPASALIEANWRKMMARLVAAGYAEEMPDRTYEITDQRLLLVARIRECGHAPKHAKHYSNRFLCADRCTNWVFKRKDLRLA